MSVLTNSIDAIQSHIYDPALTSCFVQISSSPSLLSSLTLPSIVWRVEYEYLQIPQIEQNCQTIGEVLISRLKNILQGLLLTFTCVLWDLKSTLDLYSRELTSHRQVATSGSMWGGLQRDWLKHKSVRLYNTLGQGFSYYCHQFIPKNLRISKWSEGGKQGSKHLTLYIAMTH